jgi:glutamate synthase (NADPH/NADH) small chain
MKFLERFKDKRNWMIVLGIAGVFFLLVGSYDFSDGKNDTPNSFLYEKYESTLEEKLEEFCSYIEGIENTKGVIKAVAYLSETTRSLPDLPEINAAGRNVVILGGGDTGNDCLATAIRQKCTSAVQIEMMPSPPKERRENNPWPEWPKVLKTDYGQEEAICLYGNDPRIWSTTLTNLITEDGALKAVETAKIHFEEGRPVISEERDILPCDLLIIAAGFIGCETELPLSMGIELSARNTVASEENSYASSVEGIFSCGDMHRGASLVVWAIKEGLECAREADEWMMGYTNLI